MEEEEKLKIILIFQPVLCVVPAVPILGRAPPRNSQGQPPAEPRHGHPRAAVAVP